MKSIRRLTTAGILLFWLTPVPAAASFMLMESNDYGALKVPSIFSLFDESESRVCAVPEQTEDLYAYAAWPFTGNTTGPGHREEKPRDQQVEDRTCCPCEDTVKEPAPKHPDEKKDKNGAG